MLYVEITLYYCLSEYFLNISIHNFKTTWIYINLYIFTGNKKTKGYWKDKGWSPFPFKYISKKGLRSRR